MNEKHPTSMEEFSERFHRNQYTFGYGIEGVGLAFPCPFCGAKDFMKYKIVEMEEVVSRGATCRECNRSLKGIFHTEKCCDDPQCHNETTTLRLVQTGGPKQPEWLFPQYPYTKEN